jgi:SAM-dependent methyltransferase
MENNNFYFRDSCRMCASNNLEKAMSLTPTPPGNDFLTKNELGRKENLYPLDLYFCSDCFHIQLGHVVDPKILYQKNYTYVSGTSSHFVSHLAQYSEEMIGRFNLKPDSMVIDIGSNDGTCLSFFKSHGMRVLGIDPAAEVVEIANKNHIHTINDFFSYELSISLQEQYGSVDFITSHNACAHIDNLIDIVKGVEYLLKADGVFVLEVGYFVDVYNNTWFDTIYHEHVDFHTVAPFEKLFSRVGMELIRVERISPQGGSIRIMAQKIGGKFNRDNTVDSLIENEKKLDLNKLLTLVSYEKKINIVKVNLQKLLSKLKDEGKTIAGFGAPTKATTLMNHFGINESILDYIVDENPLKQGLYTPISHIPIFPSSQIYEKKPDFVLILAWNFADQIINNHLKYAKEIGSFILPMPEPQIVNLEK